MSSNATPLRVGLAGYGLAGSVFHAPLIEATDGLALSTIVTANPGRQEQAKAAHPDARVVATFDELLADRPDLVVVASPNRTHVPLARAALEAGAAVVVDKPLAGGAAEGLALADLAAERGLLLSVFQNRRWDGDFRTVRELVRTGKLGAVRRFESRFERWRPVPKGGWREIGTDEEGAGILYDLGSHLVDQALTLFGPVATVYAEVDVRRPGAGADDDVFVALLHDSGVRSHLWMGAVTARLGPRFRVLGTRAGYVKHGLDPQEAALRDGARPVSSRDETWGTEPEELWGTLGAGDDTRPVPTLPGDYPAYYAGVAAALREGTPPPVQAVEAVTALRILEAARRSATEHRTVEL
jgi:predicted dehydrogenase